MEHNVEIDERLLKKARGRRGPDPIYMRLVIAGDPVRLMDALEELFGTVPEDDEGLGEVDWVRVGDDVIFRLRDSWNYAGELLDLAQRLGERGFAGRIEPYRRAKVPAAVQGSQYYVMARLRVGRSDQQLKVGWRVDDAVLHGIVRRAVRWCLQETPAARVLLSPGDMGSFILDPGDNHADRLTEQLRCKDPLRPVEFASLGPIGGTRWVHAHRQTGAVELHARFRSEADDDWAALYAGVRNVLRDVASELAYGFVKHGVNARPDPLAHDWPRRRDLIPRWSPRWQHEDRWAPDAFAVQALGAGYQGRIPLAPSYQVEHVQDTTILEHRDLDAWFSAPLVPAGTGVRQLVDTEPPAVLELARGELADILDSPGRDPPVS